MTRNQKIAAALTAAVAVAAPAEGLRRTWYLDPASIVTVCYGATHNVDKNRVYSIDECKAMLSAEMLTAVNTVENCTGGKLSPQQLAAFADAVYNMGPTIACDTTKSTAARMIKAGQVREACEQLPRWDKARVAGAMVSLPGLTQRRQRERELCLREEK